MVDMKVEFHYNTFLEGLLSLQDLMIPKNTPQFIYENQHLHGHQLAQGMQKGRRLCKKFT